MADTVFLVYLARYRLFVVAEYAGELGFWSKRVVPFFSNSGVIRVHTEWAASF